MIIGITGNSGSGKSEIAKLLSKKINAIIINADEIVKKLSEPGNKYYTKIIELFGKEILKNNKLNKAKIAQIIYKSQEKREDLNKLTYKYIAEEIIKQAHNISDKNVIIDAPLLFESGLDKICNYTIGIIAEFNRKTERICARDNVDANTAKARLNIQATEDFYKKRANLIVENNKEIDKINLEEICTKIGRN